MYGMYLFSGIYAIFGSQDFVCRSVSLLSRCAKFVTYSLVGPYIVPKDIWDLDTHDQEKLS